MILHLETWLYLEKKVVTISNICYYLEDSAHLCQNTSYVMLSFTFTDLISHLQSHAPSQEL